LTKLQSVASANLFGESHDDRVEERAIVCVIHEVGAAQWFAQLCLELGEERIVSQRWHRLDQASNGVDQAEAGGMNAFLERSSRARGESSRESEERLCVNALISAHAVSPN
jgi:hypothetical protein